MPKKPVGKESVNKLRPDVAEVAFRVMQEATGQAPKTPPLDARKRKNVDAVERGRKGGAKSAQSRLERTTSEARSESARKAAKARWERRSSS